VLNESANGVGKDYDKDAEDSPDCTEERHANDWCGKVELRELLLVCDSSIYVYIYQIEWPYQKLQSFTLQSTRI